MIKRNKQGKWTYKGREKGKDYGKYNQGFEEVELQSIPLKSSQDEAPPAYEATTKPSAPRINDWNAWNVPMTNMISRPTKWEGSTMYMLNEKTNEWEKSG